MQIESKIGLELVQPDFSFAYRWRAKLAMAIRIGMQQHRHRKTIAPTLQPMIQGREFDVFGGASNTLLLLTGSDGL